jgi:hypothetical protein
MFWRILFTFVFGLVWWVLFNFAGPNLIYLMILGSVLAVCVCCCGGEKPPIEFNFQHYIACIMRCLVPTLTLIVGLVFLGLVIDLITIGFSLAALLQLIAAAGATLFIRLICCAYES